MTTLRITTRHNMGSAECLTFDKRCGSCGKQISPKVREYKTDAAASDLEDIAADIRLQWHAKVELLGGHFAGKA